MTEETVVETQTTDAGKTVPQRTPQEIAEFNLKRAVEKARAEGIDPAKLIAVPLKIDETLSDETPLTVGTLKEFQKQEAKKTALQLADDIEDEDERNEVKNILENNYKPSGDPHKDLAFVRGGVTAERTRQVAEQTQRASQATRTASGGSAPLKVEDQFTPTPQEAVFMAKPYNMSKEKILAARLKTQAKQG